MCYSSYLFKSCHRCRYRNQTVVSKVHTGLMTYENSRVSSRWGNSQGNLQQQVFRRCLHVCEWRIILNVRVFLRTSFFSLFFFVTVVTIIVIKTTRQHCCEYCLLPREKSEEEEKRGGEVERARFRKRWTKRIRGKAVSNTKMVPLNLKCDSNWKRYVTLRTICIEWFRLPAENTETGHAVFKTRSSS